MMNLLGTILAWILARLFPAPKPPPARVVPKEKVDEVVVAAAAGDAVRRDVADDGGLRDYAASDPNNRDNRR